jgi:hypothetical protein
LTVTVGSAVQTLDGDRIGTISEVRGKYFKIKTGRFHRDYWLRTDSVRSSGFNEVTLNVPKAQLDGVKMVDIERLD